MSTVAEPLLMIPGPAGIQAGKMQFIVMSLTRAAGRLPINTVGNPLIIARGIGGWGTGVGTGAGG